MNKREKVSLGNLYTEKERVGRLIKASCTIRNVLLEGSKGWLKVCRSGFEGYLDF